MKQNLYARKKRQFNRLSEQVECLRHDGQWETLDTSVQKRITQKLKNLYREIYGYFSRSEWKRAVAAVGFLLLGTAGVQAQQFQAPVQNPFGLALPTGDYWNMPTLTDIDGDGDLDVFGSDYYGNPIFYQNTGSASSPAFAAGQLNPFGLSGQYTFWRATGDLDNDGDLDIMGAVQGYGYSTQFLYYENTGTSTNPSFGASQLDPFGLANVPTPGFLAMDMVDMDNDGDLDLMGVDAYNGGFYYIPNGGSASTPSFNQSQANPFGLSNAGQLSLATIGDLDLDGDLDILVGQYYGGFAFYENTGSVSAPAFAAPQLNPFGLSDIGDYNFSALGDLDDDGDLDLLTSSYPYNAPAGAWYYFENDDPSIGITEREIEAAVYPNPTRDVLNIELGEWTTGSAVVMDLTGNVILSSDFTESDRITFDLSRYSAGLYLLRIETEAGNKTLKVTKQ
ncbi:T9SS type A sorting domain-containing protein [Cryomorphaceae bacterium]|nr:T9SS type A sorting domain-containing protein [Cryomorphaceae bacterium]